MIVPVRRISQYELLFSDILQKTDENHREYASLRKAVELSRENINKIQISQSKSENIYQIYGIQMKFYGENLPNLLVVPNRKFIRYSTLQEVQENSQSRFIALFNDIIIIGSLFHNNSNLPPSFSQSFANYQFIKYLSLRKASIKLIPDHPPSLFIKLLFFFQLVLTPLP